MKFHKTLLAVSFATLVAPAAFADNFVGGEQGYETHPVAGQITREQVQREYLAFRQHPILSDGTVMLQGEAGYVSPVQGGSADRVPAYPHSHMMGNRAAASAQPQAPLNEAQQRALREQYLN